VFEMGGAVDDAENLYPVRPPKTDHDLRRVWFGRVNRKTRYRRYLVVESLLPW